MAILSTQKAQVSRLREIKEIVANTSVYEIVTVSIDCSFRAYYAAFRRYITDFNSNFDEGDKRWFTVSPTDQEGIIKIYRKC